MSKERKLPKEVLNVLNGRRLKDMAIKVVYINYKGEEKLRHILPLKIWHGSTKWHKKEQWFIRVYDLEKKANRDFALNDLRGNLQN